MNVQDQTASVSLQYHFTHIILTHSFYIRLFSDTHTLLQISFFCVACTKSDEDGDDDNDEDKKNERKKKARSYVAGTKRDSSSICFELSRWTTIQRPSKCILT